MRTMTESELVEEMVGIIAEFISTGDPHEVWTWEDLARALLAPDTGGPLADEAFVRALVELHGMRARAAKT